jgi:anti-sigma factor RsiW
MPEQTKPEPNPCAQFEESILDYFDRALSGAEMKNVETHVAGCSGCRAFWSDLKNLDVALSASLRRPSLPDGFKSQMLARAGVNLEAGTVLDAESARREIEAALAGVRRRFLRRMVLTCLDAAGCLALLAVAAILLNQWLARAGFFAGMSAQQLGTYAGILVGGAGTAAGLWISFESRIRLLLGW